VSNYQGRSAERKQARGDQGPKGNCNLLGHDKSNGSANPKFQLLPPLSFFQFPQLLAKFSLEIADHLCRGAVQELFRKLAASGEFDFDCMLFPTSIHDCMMDRYQKFGIDFQRYPFGP